MDNHLRLDRIGWIAGNSIECPEGTYGRLIFPDGTEFYTCENPWKGNQPFVSCIPTGVYYLEQRYSPVVQRTSGGEFAEGWEVTDVLNRDYIMLHVGNFPSDVEGCIAIGRSLKVMQNKQGRWCLGVSDSRNAFRELMEKMDEFNTWTLDVRPYIPGDF